MKTSRMLCACSVSLRLAFFLSITLGLSGLSFGQQDERRTVKPKRPQSAEVGPQSDVAEAKMTAKAASEKLVERTYVGLSLAEVDDAVREYLGLPHGFGVQVDDVVEGSPAAEAGVEDKDIIMSFDGQRLTTPMHLQVLVATYSKGDKIELELLRKGASKTLQITLGEAKLLPLAATTGDDENASPAMALAPLGSATPTAVQVVPKADGELHFVRPNADPEAIRKQVQEYRDKMSEWMKQPAAGRGPAPTLKLNVNPHQAEVRVHRMQKVDVGASKAEDEDETKVESSAHSESSTSHSSSGASIRVGGDSAGIRVNGGSSIVIGPGASIRTTGSSGGQVKIANAHGSVVVKQEDGKSVIEISDADGEVIHKGPWKAGKKMTEGLPPGAQAVLKIMNLQQLDLLNIKVGPQGAKPPKEKGGDKENGKQRKGADASAEAGEQPAAAVNYRGSASEKAD